MSDAAEEGRCELCGVLLPIGRDSSSCERCEEDVASLCPHFNMPEDCVMCDEGEHLTLLCGKCEGNTWHQLHDGIASCRRCGTVRTDEPGPGDLGIGK